MKWFEETHLTRRGLLQVGLAAMMIGLAGGLSAQYAAAKAEETAKGGRPYYLMDNRVVESSKGVQLDVCPPKKAGPVLTQEKPWESFYMQGTSLVRHDGEYLLYYMVYTVAKKDGKLDTKGNRWMLCLATSKDGLDWQRPELGQMEYAGSKANNIVLDGTGCVSLNGDPDAPPEHRFLLMGIEKQTNMLGAEPGFILDRLLLYTSADGRVWKQTTGPLAPFTCDSQNQVYYDPAIKKHRVYLRGFSGRRTTHWYEPPDLFKPWPIRPEESNKGSTFSTAWGVGRAVYVVREMPIAMDTGRARQVYNPGVVPIEGMHLAFPDIFRIFPGRVQPDKKRFPDSELYQWSNDGFVAPQLFVSEDGRSFRPIGTKPYIDLGFGEAMDSRQVRMITGYIQQGNEYWQYYSGHQTGHTIQRGRRPRKACAVMRTIQRKDGFAAMIAGPEVGEVVTTPVTCSGPHLLVNYDAGAWGEVRVELLDTEGRPIPNYTLADSAPLIANEVYVPVLWSDRRDLTPLAGKQVRIRFQFKDARLFSFRFKCRD